MSTSLEVPEALLEMRYFEPLWTLFEGMLGANFVQLLKPTQRGEKWIGVDQVWSTKEIPQERLFTEISESVEDSSNPVSVYVAFFLQFKVVHRMKRAYGQTRDAVRGKHFRVDLDTEPKWDKDGNWSYYSQHEVMKRVSQVDPFLVWYACPFIFTADEVLKRPVQLEEIKFVVVDGDTPDYSDEERHHICFQTRSSLPQWCSEPVPGKLTDIKKLAEKITESPLAGKELVKDLKRLREEAEITEFPDSLTVMEFRKPAPETKRRRRRVRLPEK